MHHNIDFEVLKRVSAVFILSNHMSGKQLKQIDSRLSASLVQKAFAQNAASPGVQALQQFVVCVLRREIDMETRLALARCLSFFTESQTILAYQHIFELFLEEM